MAKFTIEISETEFTETLEYEGKTITKRYKRDQGGFSGLDKSWDYETMPASLADALWNRDPLEIMDALRGYDAEFIEHGDGGSHE